MSNDFGGNSVTPDYEVTADDKMWGLIAHLSPLVGIVLGGLTPVGPLVVWLIKKDQSQFVATNAKEALAFSIGAFVITLVTWVITVVLMCVGIGILLIPVILLEYLAYIAYIVIGAMRANDGKIFQYPLTSKFVK